MKIKTELDLDCIFQNKLLKHWALDIRLLSNRRLIMAQHFIFLYLKIMLNSNNLKNYNNNSNN